MKFHYLKNAWDAECQTYHHHVLVESPIFVRKFIISIEPEEPSDHQATSQRKKVGYALNEYPRHFIDSRLSPLGVILDYRFGKGKTKILFGKKLRPAALYLKSHQDTKNVATDKIRGYVKNKK